MIPLCICSAGVVPSERHLALIWRIEIMRSQVYFTAPRSSPKLSPSRRQSRDIVRPARWPSSRAADKNGAADILITICPSVGSSSRSSFGRITSPPNGELLLGPPERSRPAPEHVFSTETVRTHRQNGAIVALERRKPILDFLDGQHGKISRPCARTRCYCARP